MTLGYLGLILFDPVNMTEQAGKKLIKSEIGEII
jgi:hypothetical protein